MMIRSFLPVGQGAFYCEQFMDDLKREWVMLFMIVVLQQM